jgi:hypothetical protein
MRTSPIQTAFNSGEISPLLHGRADYQRFQTGLRTCNGFLPIRQGGVTRMPGTQHLGSTHGDQEARLIPFTFSVADSVVIEMTAYTMRVWRYADLIHRGEAPYVLPTPYDIAAVRRLQWVQSADVIYLADGVLPIHRLERRALNDWAIAPFEPDDGPFETGNLDQARTMNVRVSGEPRHYWAGTVVSLEGEGDVFTADMVGSLIQIEAFEHPDIPLFVTNSDVRVGDYLRAEGRLYQLVEVGGNGTDGHAGKTGNVVPSHAEGIVLTDPDVRTKWRFVSDGRAVLRIETVTGGTDATATVVRTVPPSIVNRPTYRWARAAWSPVNGYPAALEIYEQRLVAAATRAEPRTIWFSAVGSFGEWAAGVDADAPFAYRISGSDSLNTVLWLKAGARGLHVGSLGQLYSVRSETAGAAIGPTNFMLGLDAGTGTHHRPPLAPDGKPILISQDRHRVYEMAYAFAEDQVRPVELSLAAEHLGPRLFEDLVWQDNLQRIVWGRMADGTLTALLYDPQEEVQGWARLSVAGGHVESLTTYVNPTDGRDILMMVVRREIGGRTVRFIERQMATWGLQVRPAIRANHLFAIQGFDAGDGEPQSTFQVSHLDGQAVYAWTEAGTLGPAVVTDGEVTFEHAVRNAFVGLLDETHEVETLPIRAASRDGDTTGRKLRLKSGGGVRLHRTAGGTVAAVARDLREGTIAGDVQHLVPDVIGGDDQAIVSGVSEMQVQSGFASEVSLRFRPSGAAPMTVLTATAVIEEAGG